MADCVCECMDEREVSFAREASSSAFHCHEVAEVVADRDIAKLMSRIALRDRTALREFYDLYVARVGSFLMKQLKNPDLVGEVVNDVFLAVWQSAGQFDPAKGRFTTWLFGIARNKGLKSLERARRFSGALPLDIGSDELAGGDEADVDADHRDPAPTPEHTVLVWELLDVLAESFDALTPEHREIIDLTMNGDYSYLQIAESLGCPVNTVKTRMFNARKKLCERLERKGFAPATLRREGWL